MITYAERSCFTRRQVELWLRATQLIGRVSNTWRDELRCHELVRAVAHGLRDTTIRVVDGKRGPIEHSWIVTNDERVDERECARRQPPPRSDFQRAFGAHSSRPS